MKNACYRIIDRRSTDHLPNILSDQVIEFKGFYSHRKLPYRLRRIHAKDPETGKRIVLLTNHMTWSAKTIALVYKDRWQIEIFFKTLKQQLKVKSFVGTSRNALLSQLWAAMIAYLLLSYLKFKSKFGWSLYTLSSILPTNLFSHRNLWDWLNAPFGASSPSPPEVWQREFAFG
jgi:IS4 transposase